MECPWDLEFVPDGFITKRMCKCVKKIEDNPWSLAYVPDHFKTEEMFEKAVEDKPEALEYVPDHFKTKGMCERASRIDPCNLEFVRDRFKTQKICDKTVNGCPYSLLFVPDWFMTQKQLKIWHNELIRWCNCYKKRKAQKVLIKEELWLRIHQGGGVGVLFKTKTQKQKNCENKPDPKIFLFIKFGPWLGSGHE